jgi:uncharacterized protein YjbI with pentapeptide repeats
MDSDVVGYGQETPKGVQHESRRTCVLHYPGKDKSSDFKAALDSKLNKKDFDFSGVWFPDEVHFTCFEFTSAANFSSATFSAATYFTSATFSAGAYFGSTKFNGDAYFRAAKFAGDAHFVSSTFSAKVDFIGSTFSADADFLSADFGADALFAEAMFSPNAHFFSAKFNARAVFYSAKFTAAAQFSFATFSVNADFSDAIFRSQADFSHATFSGCVRFSGSEAKPLFDATSSLNLQHARIERPENISFHTATLRPHWFLNVDARKFDFTNVMWNGLFDRHYDILSEIKCAIERDVPSPRRLLALAYRQLAVDAEENHRSEQASRFRYWAMELRRHDKWRGRRFWKTDWLHMAYWAVSGYGERIWLALLWLLAVWIVFAWLYIWVGFAEQLSFFPAVTHSLAVMSLQKPEPRPLTNWAHTLVTLETILGPVQAALLALAIRRKFMR